MFETVQFADKIVFLKYQNSADEVNEVNLQIMSKISELKVRHILFNSASASKPPTKLGRNKTWAIVF